MKSKPKSKRHSKKNVKKDVAESANAPSAPATSDDLPFGTESLPPALNPWQRGLISLLICAFLIVVLIGPLSNPIASRHLTAPLATWVSPLHRALFLGHGYRFFAPDPGPAHLVEYKITHADGKQVKKIFPDRDAISPRLLYHRWFMLSETIYAEHAQTPSPREFERLDLVRARQIRAFQKGGRAVMAKALQRTRDRETAQYQRTLKRIKILVRDIGQFLLEREGGAEIELTVVTRTLPFPDEVRQGADLDDERFLRYEANPVIGRFTTSDFFYSGVREVPATDTSAIEEVQQ